MVAEPNGDVRRSWGYTPFSSLGFIRFYFNMHECFPSYRPDVMSAISNQCLNFQLETERLKPGCLYSRSLHPLLPWGDLTWPREEETKPPWFCLHQSKGLYSSSLCSLSIPCTFLLTWKKNIRQNKQPMLPCIRQNLHKFEMKTGTRQLCPCLCFTPTGWLCLVPL